MMGVWLGVGLEVGLGVGLGVWVGLGLGVGVGQGPGPPLLRRVPLLLRLLALGRRGPRLGPRSLAARLRLRRPPVGAEGQPLRLPLGVQDIRGRVCGRVKGRVWGRVSGESLGESLREGGMTTRTRMMMMM